MKSCLNIPLLLAVLLPALAQFWEGSSQFRRYEILSEGSSKVVGHMVAVGAIEKDGFTAQQEYWHWDTIEEAWPSTFDMRPAKADDGPAFAEADDYWEIFPLDSFNLGNCAEDGQHSQVKMDGCTEIMPIVSMSPGERFYEVSQDEGWRHIRGGRFKTVAYLYLKGNERGTRAQSWYGIQNALKHSKIGVNAERIRLQETEPPSGAAREELWVHIIER